MKMNRQGYTLIELLVVIGLIFTLTLGLFLIINGASMLNGLYNKYMDSPTVQQIPEPSPEFSNFKKNAQTGTFKFIGKDKVLLSNGSNEVLVKVTGL